MMRVANYMSGLECLRCGRRYQMDEVAYVCGCRPNRGSDLGTLDVLYDYDRLRQEITADSIGQDGELSIGRYAPLLPIRGRERLPRLAVGNTPLVPALRLGEELGLANLYVKDDGRNPTASLKDRASAIAVARAQDAGFSMVATASTGNAAAALAGQCASAGQRNVIFVPRSAPVAKIAQLLAYGSIVLAIDGSYDQAYDLCTEACQAFGWYNRNTGYNPYMSEGKKTVAYEIAEQLARIEKESVSGRRFVAPDVVFVSVGDGCIIGGVYKGFYDLLRLGWIEWMPRIMGVQSTRSAAIYNGWVDGRAVPVPVEATTRANSISVNAPRDGIKALRAVRESGGEMVAVSDEEILAAILPLARLEGVFAEPAGAAAYAGLRHVRQQGGIEPGERVVVINTGSGLKDVAAVREVTGELNPIGPTLSAVRDVLEL